ncbi:hypothetical protein O6H91_23G072000 [Diphasiastrum complanatum]|uniref:Uncharacterized protein n=1 Tax=Diphasiastrum complanatum TaxID=34168 RepID=A0ACC2AE24_DIPCM|nr:hypothetical protein O6H91_23G072000 [Diphasiastrum complanatum]
MDEQVNQLKESLVEVETIAEQLLLAQQQLVELDKSRNANREALTTLRRQARTSRSSVPKKLTEIENDKEKFANLKCLTCGNSDQSAPMWMMFPGADVFARLPFHQAHCSLEKDQEEVELNVKRTQSTIKEKMLMLSDRGAIADRIGPSLVRSMVTLKDSGNNQRYV